MATPYSATEETTNYARLCRIYVELLRDVLWEVVCKKIPANQLKNQIISFLLNVHHYKPVHHQLRKLSQLPGDPQSTDCDISVLYFILRNVSSLQAPTGGWDAPPLPTPKEVADDVERIRNGRNKVYGHSNTASISNPLFQSEIQQVTDILGRLDNHVGKNFTANLNTIIHDNMDPQNQQIIYQQYVIKLSEQDQKLQTEIEGVKKQVSDTEKILKEELEKTQSEVRDTKSNIKIIEDRLTEVESAAKAQTQKTQGQEEAEPSQPQNFKAVESTTKEVTFQWTFDGGFDKFVITDTSTLTGVHYDVVNIVRTGCNFKGTLTGLAPATLYKFSIYAVQHKVSGKPTESVEIATQPTQPKDFKEVETLTTEVTFEWKFEGGWEIFVITDTNTSIRYDMINVESGCKTFSGTLTGLHPATLYKFSIHAVKHHTVSQHSDFIQVVTKPNQPENFKAVKAATTDVTLEWTFDGGYDRFVIADTGRHYDMTNTERHGSTFRGTLDGLTPATLYNFSIHAVKYQTIGESTDIVEVVTKPNQPENFQAVDATTSEVTFQWSLDGSYDRFVIIDINTSKQYEVTNVEIDDSNFKGTLAGLTPATRYRFSIHVLKHAAIGESTEAIEVDTRSQLPEEIMRMDEESINLYEKALIEGSVPDYSIRVMVVGPYGVGKTTLTRRLIGVDVDINDRSSTEGIDIHQNRCRVSRKDRKWRYIKKDRALELVKDRLTNLLAEKNDSTHTVKPMVKMEVDTPLDVKLSPSSSAEYHFDSADGKQEEQRSQISELGHDTERPPADSSEAGGTQILASMDGDSKEVDGTRPKSKYQGASRIRKIFKKFPVTSKRGSQKKAEKSKEQIPPPERKQKAEKAKDKKQTQDLQQEEKGRTNDERKKDNLQLKQEEVQKTNKQFKQDFQQEDEKTKDEKMKQDLQELIDREHQIDSLGEVDINFWDFAGQKIFLSTHQLFLSRHAVYILVADLSKEFVNDESGGPFFKGSDEKNIPLIDILELWLESIHNCAENKETPKVILVGTHDDQAPVRKGDSKYFDEFRQRVGEKPSFYHLASEDFYIDNSSVNRSHDLLRKIILDTAPKYPDWGRQVPAKWLDLQRVMLKLRANMRIANISGIEAINKRLPIPLEARELDLYLRFHHQCGTFLCYSDDDRLTDIVVLDPQFVVDALKSLITSDDFCNKKPYYGKWREFHKSGILTVELLDNVWEEKLYHEHREQLILLLEKARLIANLQNPDGSKRGDYLVPCMLQHQAEDKLFQPRYYDDSHTTPVLVFSFTGMSSILHIFNRLSAACLSKWQLAKEGKAYPIYSNCAVLNINPTHVLTITCMYSAITLWITRVGQGKPDPDLSICEDVRNSLTSELTSMENYKLRIMCRESGNRLDCVEESKDIPFLTKEKEFSCMCNRKLHLVTSETLLKYWFSDVSNYTVPDSRDVSKMTGPSGYKPIQLWDIMDFNKKKLPPVCEYDSDSRSSRILLNLNFPHTLNFYPGTTGTTTFNKDDHFYIPWRLYVTLPTSSKPPDTVLAEVSLAPHNETAALKKLRQDTDTITFQFLQGDVGNVVVSCIRNGVADRKSVPTLESTGGGFMLHLGLVIKGPRSKVSVVDSETETVIHEVGQVDFSRRLVPLFGVFRKQVECKLFHSFTAPAFCRSLTERPITVLDDVRFNQSTVHPVCNLRTFTDHQELSYEPLSEVPSSSYTTGRFTKYTGAMATVISNDPVSYMHCRIYIQSAMPRPTDDGVIAEMSVCRLGQIDQSDRIAGKNGGITVQVLQDGKKIKIIVLHGENVCSPIKRLPVYRFAEFTAVDMGLLVDVSSRAVHVIDSRGNALVRTVDNVDFTEELSVVFGVFSEHVEIGLFHKPNIPGICQEI